MSAGWEAVKGILKNSARAPMAVFEVEDIVLRSEDESTSQIG